MKKNKILAFIMCLVLSTMLVSCDVVMEYTGVDVEAIVDDILKEVISEALGVHTCTYDEWTVTIEPTCAEEGEEEAECIICFETGVRPIAKLDHTPENVEEVAPTCTENGHSAGVMCSECGEPISDVEIIPALGHTERIIAAIPATETTPGKTEGKDCSVCGVIIVKPKTVYADGFNAFVDHNMYDGTYAYNSLASLENGAAMQAFYWEIDAVADEFHNSDIDAQIKKVGGIDTYYAAEVEYADNGLTSEEALSVWNAYSIDHPLYYWISKQVSYAESEDKSRGYITIIVDDDYATAAARQAYNVQIYAVVKEYIEELDDETDVYEITYIFYNLIMNDAEYAYLPDGVTPSNEDWAHNIIGVMLEGEGVCESYAKAFQLLLNYCEIECIFVAGQANGGAHAWNMVEVSEGNWYWYDLTWDDSIGRLDYFCVNDMYDHVAYAPGGTGVSYSFVLPEPAKAPYAK